MSTVDVHWSEFGPWGLCGGAAVFAIEFWGVMRVRHGRLPVRYTRFWYWAGGSCRILVGGVLAVALGQASQVTVPLGAFTVGVAAPLILARLGEYVPPLPTSADAAADEEKP